MRVRLTPRNIDGHGRAWDRKMVNDLMRRSGAEDRKAQAKRDRRAAKRAKDVEVEEA